MELVVIPKIVHNNTEKVKDVVVCLLSIKGDSDFALCESDRLNDYRLVLRKFVYYLFVCSVVGLRY